MNLPALLWLGFLLAMRHALDADHIAAVSTIVARERSLRTAVPIGMLWGLGHSLSLLLVGGAIVAFKVVIPPRLGSSLELCVGVMLVGLGALSLRHALARRGHVHHRLEEPASGRRHPLRPLLIGVVHGLAGSAAVGLLVLGAVQDVAAGLLYLLVFGLGTMVGMVLFTTALALPVTLLSLRFEPFQRVLGVVTGAASVALGALLAFQIGAGFAAQPLGVP